jgi:biotin---protein ligase
VYTQSITINRRANHRIRAAQLNKADGDADYVGLIDDLLAHDAGRNAFLHAILVKLGLKISSTADNITERNVLLTPLHISSVDQNLNRTIYNTLLAIADTHPGGEDDTFTMTDTHNTFQVRYLTSLDSIQDKSEPLTGSPGSNELDPVPTRIFFHSLPSKFPHFSPERYFDHLPLSSTIGRTLAYVETIASTQTLLAKNTRLLRTLPVGFVLLATSQLKSHGRAGNTWISPLGMLAFSFILHLPRRLSSRLIFVNYLVSLAVVEAIRTYATGWENVNVKIKWPNDIYGKSRYADRWEKIGGVMVNSTYFGDEFILVVGKRASA